ncbi:MAG TPA: DoxX family protein [Acidobacteriaceae bacterium]|nr:DoxX family protein [Acidobacteriaceae bacterium]
MSSSTGTAVLPHDTSLPGSGRRWAGFIMTGLIALFMLFDAAMKFVAPKPVAAAFVRSGWPIDLSLTLGVILLTSTVLYLIPRTAVLGAILLTGYLGGAVATNLRLHNPWFSNTLFPVYFGILVWGALWLRDPRVAELIPLRGRR